MYEHFKCTCMTGKQLGTDHWSLCAQWVIQVSGGGTGTHCGPQGVLFWLMGTLWGRIGTVDGLMAWTVNFGEEEVKQKQEFCHNTGFNIM